MITIKQISEIVNEKLHGTELFLVEAHVGSDNHITVFIDADTHVSISDCAELSRFIESKLDRDKEDFELEVSSAGLDLPIKLHRQFIKNIGNDVKIITRSGKSFIAALLGAGDDNITVLIPENKKKKMPEEHIVLTLSDIKEVKVIIKINNNK
ncbi:MAG TPA: ribosome assembly cofactor RimP [Bacteroidales bacterium]|nr:ribosome assembly cofactor RimP [Bacteroidales bacterium]